MPVLLCDTDFLIKITNDPVPELQPFLLGNGFSLSTLPVIERELQGLQKNKTNSTARKARLALLALGKFVQVETNYGKNSNAEADLQLVDFEEKSPGDVVIATMDGNLLAKLERKRLPYFTLRRDRPFFRQFARATYLTTKKP